MRNGRFLTVFQISLILLFQTPGLDAAGKKARASGYAEYQKAANVFIIEGQIVRITEKTKYKGKGGVRSLDAIQLGYQAKIRGKRDSDGIIIANRIEAVPNRPDQSHEQQILELTNKIEAMWVEAGEMFYPQQDGSKKVIGKLLTKGKEVQRVNRLMDRLLPPYIKRSDVRVRVVVTDEWNASAMANGAIWVYTGLMSEMTDEQLAIILGHELAHYTHEHSRRNASKAKWSQLAAIGAAVGGAAVGGAAGSLASLGGSLGASALGTGYSRDFEDQADRVGLRYAYEGEFNVFEGPALWGKFRDEYGEQDSFSNFFFGSHSRPTDRIENIQRELTLNYVE